MKFIGLWALAMTYAIWCYNRIPPSTTGMSPEELWSRTKSTRSTIKRARVFGCPVYVLDPKLQDGKSIPKWNSKACQGVFVGFSEEHSSTVALVYNPKTQHISPQYHIIFDDTFSMVPFFANEQQQNETFEKLFENGCGNSVQYFVDPADAEAGRVTDNWTNADNGDGVEGTGAGGSEGAQDGVPEGAGTSEGASEVVAPDTVPFSNTNPLHRNESRPVQETAS
jgi:hypothetical protein